MSHRFLTILMAAPVVVACATVPRQPTLLERVAQLTAGTTTKTDAIALLGKPKFQTHFPDGREVLQWMDGSSGTFEHAALVFRPDGVMAEVSKKAGS